jgi:hypothetical protein
MKRESNSTTMLAYSILFAGFEIIGGVVAFLVIHR